MSRMTSRQQSKAPSESTIQEEDEFSEAENSEITDVSENKSFLSLFEQVLSRYEKIDLICLLDELLCQNLDVRYSQTADSLSLHTALAAIAILMAKLGLVDQALEKLETLLAKSCNINSLTTAIEININLKRPDKAEKLRRKLDILKKEDFDENDDFGPIERARAGINSKNYLIAEKILFLSHLKHDEDEDKFRILDLFGQLDQDFEMEEVEFVLLKIQLKDMAKNPRSSQISKIPDSSTYSTDTGFGICNWTLLGLINSYKNIETGTRMIKSSIEYASTLKDMLTMDRLTKILLDNERKAFALAAASQNLEVPTIQALECEAVVQFDNSTNCQDGDYDDISRNDVDDVDEDFQLISNAEKTISNLVAGYDDSFSPNLQLSMILLDIRMLMLGHFSEYELEFTERSVSADIIRLEIRINMLNVEPRLFSGKIKMLSHMGLAIFKTKLHPDKRLDIYSNALKTPTVNHEGNVDAMVTVIRDIADSSDPKNVELPTMGYETLDSLVKTKLFVEDGEVIRKYRNTLRKIFKSDKLANYCFESSNAGFLNLNKLCFEIMSLSKSQIDGIIGEKINRKIVKNVENCENNIFKRCETI